MNDNEKIQEPNPPVIPVSLLNFKNCATLADRSLALHMIPKNGIVAEIGVAYGEFSKKILAVTEPKLFFAIDSFYKKKGDSGFFGRDIFKDISHLDYYTGNFQKELENGVMEIRQGLSWDVLESFDDNYFDYLYIDAGHSYRAVRKDLYVAKKKIKDGGYIQFNDYMLWNMNAGQQYGVVQAVNEFLNKSNHQARAFCLHPHGCYDILIEIHKK